MIKKIRCCKEYGQLERTDVGFWTNREKAETHIQDGFSLLIVKGIKYCPYCGKEIRYKSE